MFLVQLDECYELLYCVGSALLEAAANETEQFTALDLNEDAAHDLKQLYIEVQLAEGEYDEMTCRKLMKDIHDTVSQGNEDASEEARDSC
jgi:hypothetical protein